MQIVFSETVCVHTVVVLVVEAFKQQQQQQQQRQEIKTALLKI